MRERHVGSRARAALRPSCLGAVLLAACSTSGHAGTHPGGHASDAAVDAGSEHLASDAFVWGYPLVVSRRTMQRFAQALGTDQLLNATVKAVPGVRLIVAPNADTLYSVAVIDLRSEPMVLTVPDVTDRYWTYQFLDPWTDSFRYIGTRATGGTGGSFVITPPGWSGTVPQGTEQIESPTPTLFLLGRYLVKSDADIANVNAITRTLVPLSTLAGSAAPPAPPALGDPEGTPPEAGSNGAAFFDELGDALALSPPATAADKAALVRFATLGIGPGLHPSATADSAARAILEEGVTSGLARVTDAANGVATPVNGWMAPLDVGVYDDPLVRAAIAKFLWAANVPEEAVYPISRADVAGDPYTGAKRYVMHFDPDALPPVEPTSGFWSLTLYGTDMYLVDNPIHRYALGDRTPGLTRNADGSLDLYVQTDAPQGHEGNWLPAPAGQFYLMLRLYLPQQPVLDGSYVYPQVKVAQ